MNAGKLVAEIAVVAIVVYCCYGAFVDAIPTNPNDLSNPVSGLDTLNISTSPDADPLNLKMTITGELTNNLPQNLVDMSVAIFLGNGNKMLELASVKETLPSKQPVILSKELIIPTYAVLAYAACTTPDGDNLTLPFCTQISFKYLEWQGSHLLDLSMTVNHPMELKGTAPKTVVEGDKATVTITANEGILHDVMGQISTELAAGLTLTCGDATLTLSKDGNDLEFIAQGADGKNAAKQLEDYMDAHEGTITFAHDGEDYPLSPENSQSLLNIIKMLYTEGSA